MKRFALLTLLTLMTALLAACGASATPSVAATQVAATVAAEPTDPPAAEEPATAEPVEGEADGEAPGATEGLVAAPTDAAEQAATEPAASPLPDLATLNVGAEPAIEGLQLPTAIANAGDGSGRLFVVEKAGVIRVVQGGEVLSTPFLNISGRVGAQASEQGLLGLAFHPNYAQNGQFFVDYTDRRGNTVVSRFTVTADPNVADPASEEAVLNVGQPAQNHNGGNLAFGPDGYLYIGLGDGGGAGDTYGNGQNTTTVLGTILRIDVDQLPYSIPPDNPFVGDDGVLDEIWAYGLRNPWRFSFDNATGDLYIADVGQNVFEEVDYQPAGTGGQNYGWPIMEGAHCYPEQVSCDSTGLVTPIAEYDHTQGCSITGGYVYRGEQFAAMQGVYFYGDYCSGKVWAAAPAADGGWQIRELMQINAGISTFGQGEAGELYLADMRSGTIFHLVAR